LRSFRLRLLFGSLLWTLALLAVAHMMFILVVFHSFSVSHRIILVLALLTMAAGAMFVNTALVPFRRLRARLVEVRDGRSQVIAGAYPTEVQPLIDDLNNLLEQRERSVRRAQAKAGDLAHGLKTPLAILAQEAERTRREGKAESAAILSQQVERMRRQIEYHLAQARASSGSTPGVRCSVRDAADGLIRTLKRLYTDRDVTFQLEIADDHFVRVQREDLEEMLGNLLDNACKWGKNRVELSTQLIKGEILIVVEDDGPGISRSARKSVLQRGVRADETAPGSGLGLAIVRELVEMNAGSISLGESPLRGLKVSLVLPSAG
jgi:signal transduction histidine kinase